MGRYLSWLTAVVLLLLAASSCSDSPCETEERTATCPETEDAALKFLALSYNGKDVEAYGDILSEDFIFQFFSDATPGTIPDSTGPLWWGKTEDLASTGNMFSDPLVGDITFAYEYVLGWSPYEEIREDTTYLAMACRIEPHIEISLNRIEEPNVFSVGHSWLDVTVIPDPAEAPCWLILRIEEHLMPGKIVDSGAAHPNYTWSAIKALWKPD